MSSTENDEGIVSAVQHWIARAVIGLNLCPFAKSVYIKDQIRYVVSQATSEQDVLAELERELKFLGDADPLKIDTTLLILPGMFDDFLGFNDFLKRTPRAVKRTGLDGVLQIASFHPNYQFADRDPDDIENYTNRAPYPVLHLLREASVANAVAAFPDAATIYERNEETLRRLGHQGWAAWMDKHAAH